MEENNEERRKYAAQNEARFRAERQAVHFLSLSLSFSLSPRSFLGCQGDRLSSALRVSKNNDKHDETLEKSHQEPQETHK